MYEFQLLVWGQMTVCGNVADLLMFNTKWKLTDHNAHTNKITDTGVWKLAETTILRIKSFEVRPGFRFNRLFGIYERKKKYDNVKMLISAISFVE